MKPGDENVTKTQYTRAIAAIAAAPAQALSFGERLIKQLIRADQIAALLDPDRHYGQRHFFARHGGALAHKQWKRRRASGWDR